MKKELFEKIVLSIIGTWIGTKLQLFIPILILLGILMIIDYISGMLAAKREALDHPNNKRYGWSSKKSIIGIYKKVGYVFTIFTTSGIDYMLYRYAQELGLSYQNYTNFGLLVTIWFVINEILSILENVGRMGTKLPMFLRKILSELQKSIDED